MRSVVAILLAVCAVAAPSDLRRAHQKVPGVHVIGDGHVGMAVKLNAALRAMKDVKVKACDEFSVEDLINLQRKLHQARDPTLEAIYHEAGDLGRRMGAFGRYSENLQDIEEFWAEEAKTLKASRATQRAAEGSSNAPNKSPCNHIFTPDLGAFIYTPKTSLEVEADGKFCCRTVKAGSKTFTGAVPRDWMKMGTYAGTYSDFKGDHYSGQIKMFTFSGGLSFWYYTQPDGTPVQQGEGCEQPGGKKPTACQKMMPIVLYHDFDPATFKNATFTQSDFDVPDICKSTTVSCAIPGDSVAIMV